MHPKAMNCRIMHIFKGVRVEEFHLKGISWERNPNNMSVSYRYIQYRQWYLCGAGFSRVTAEGKKLLLSLPVLEQRLLPEWRRALSLKPGWEVSLTRLRTLHWHCLCSTASISEKWSTADALVFSVTGTGLFAVPLRIWRRFYIRLVSLHLVDRLVQLQD